MKPPRILALAIVIHQLHNVVLQWVNNKLFLFNNAYFVLRFWGTKLSKTQSLPSVDEQYSRDDRRVNRSLFKVQ